MEDDRKQRFRFHKEDEILLLNIVLRASPCPYNISTRDGAIMVAWNNIAEEFKSLCKPRPDGKVPHSRTCRTRCDKMITDYLAMQASPQLRGKKLESKDDRIKNELVARLSALQGKGLDPNLIAAAAEAGAGAGSGAGSGAGAGAGAGGDSPSNSDDPISNLSPAISPVSGIPGSSELMTHVTGSASGTSLMTPGQVLGRASGNQGMNGSPLLSHTGHLQQHHSQPHHQHHHQQQEHYQQHHHQQLSSQQAASELLAASALLLPTTMGGMHSSAHQSLTPTSASTSIFATPNSTAGTVKVDKKGKQVIGSRKRRVNNTTTAEVQAQQQQHQSGPVSTASFEALQRQNLSGSTANINASQTSVLTSTKRLRSSAKQATSTTTTTTMPTYTQQQSQQQQQQQQVNGGRTMMGVLGHGVGSGFTSNDLTGLSSLSSNSHNHSFPDIHSVHDFGDDNDDDDDDQDDHNNIDDDDDDDDDDDGGDTGFHDTQDAFDSTYDNNNFEHDLDGVSPASQMEASTLLSFQKGALGSNGGSGTGGYRKNKNSKQMMMSDNNGQSSRSSSMRNKGSNNGGGGQLRHGHNNNNNNNAGLGFGAGAGGSGGGGGGGGGGYGGMSMISTGFGASGGFLQLSQLNADDRAYLMRLVALEEQRVKIEVDKVALERERLALENRRLEWKMHQMNHQ
ncbi:hypothetical protein KI688_009520 [Linnemannia hyalina]|uniref:Uncharacterized protein n=1 Tax=Linnemannia hyalina TaxID=64524 RepID=A0A9P7Y0T8_9FUNG|nr:hypothetical protein KI688_009520 [Linnemannia hyalina]